MPIDTEVKRRSAIACGLPHMTMFPVPDGALNQGDRQQAAAMYRAILAAGGAAAAQACRLLLLGVGR
jgi:hypothetical protein